MSRIGPVLVATILGPSSYAYAQDGDLVYRITRDLSDLESPAVTVDGDGLVTTASGQEYVDESTLTDSDGNGYRLTATVGQETEDSPLLSTVEVTTASSVALTDDEMETGYLSHHPGATADSFWAMRANNSVVPEHALEVDPVVASWIADGSDAPLDVEITLRGGPPLDLPKATSGLAVLDPELALDLQYDRILAIEQRKTDLEVLQAGAADAVAAAGGRVLKHHWAVNQFRALITSAAFEVLVQRDDVLAVAATSFTEPDTNNAGSEIHHATQVTQFLEEGHTGGYPSGRSLISDIYVVIVDAYFDQDHPAWANRLVDWWYWDNGTSAFVQAGGADDSATSLPASYGNHGSLVSTALLADRSTDTADSVQEDRSGEAPGVSFSFVQKYDPTNGALQAGLADMLEEALTFDADIVNMSQSVAMSPLNAQPPCKNSVASDVSYVDALYIDGVFIVDTPGDYTSSTACYVHDPAIAAGSFTPGAYNVDVPQDTLNTADLYAGSTPDVGSPRGGQPSTGRQIIDLVAPEGRQGLNAADWDDTYWDQDAVAGTSFAAPVIAGAAADVKDLMVQTWGSSPANLPGNLFTTMLIMGDGQLESGFADSSNPQADNVWGMGRLRMRMFDSVGMDSPWGAGLDNYNLDDTHSQTTKINWDGATHLAIPADADYLKVVVWWFEPNLDTDNSEVPASILVKVCNEGQVLCYDSNSAAPDARRVIVPSPAGDKWKIYVEGTSIPLSTDPNYFYGLAHGRRKIHLVWYFEDQLRDDANGPACGDDIDLDCASCCAQPGSVCDTGECL